MSKDLAQNIEKTPQRAALKGLGHTDEEIAKPLIGVIFAFNEAELAHASIEKTLESIKLGVALSGGLALSVPVTSISTALSAGHVGSRYALLSREIIADSVEGIVLSHEFDGIVLLGSTEEVVSGMLMGAARVNVPTILMSNGLMQSGTNNGKKVGFVDAFNGYSAVRSGRISLDELKEIENNACVGAGCVDGLYAFNSLNILGEALGMALPESSTSLALSAEHIKLAKKTGQAIMKLVSNDIKPRMIMTKSAFLNALTVDMAMGGSTSAVMQLIAIADECGIKLDYNTVSLISDKTPILCKLFPLSDADLIDFKNAGGVMALLSELERGGLIEKNALSVANKQLSRSFSAFRATENGVIQSFSSPHSPIGGISILKGNMCEDGAIVRRCAIDQANTSFVGKAKVFDSEEEAVSAVLDGLIKKGDVLVVRYEGPQGGPGMRSLFHLGAVLSGMGLNKDVALLTDGRLSDSYLGLSIGHICPEAHEGGKLALIKDGDKIEIDVIKGKLNLEINAKEIQTRTKKWKPRDVSLSGSLLKYSHLVTSAYLGAVLKKKF